MRHHIHEKSHRSGGHGRHHRSRRGDLSTRLLAMIASRPAQGHDLLRALDGQDIGPDAIYPTLALLEDQGLIEAIVEAGKKRYHATEAGQAALRQRSGMPEAIVQAVTQFGSILRTRLSDGPIADEAATAIAAAIDTVSLSISMR